MFNALASALFRRLARPAFRVYGKSTEEPDWRVIEVYATHRRDYDSRWPRFLFRGTCITWSASVVAVGWDFAEEVLREQAAEPASRERPVSVRGGRIRDLGRRLGAGAEPWASASEVLAHECGHTAQALRLGWLYLPAGAAFTLFREGPHWYNHFENQASERGLFGGVVNGSVHPWLMERLRNPGPSPAPSEGRFDRGPG
jgi:hypothetical protein